MASPPEPRERYDQELLDRHRPLLLFDPQYDYRVLAAESAVENEGNLLRRFDGEVLARSRGDPELSLELLTRYPAGVEADPDDSIAMSPDYAGDSRRMERSDRHRGRIYARVVDDGTLTWCQYWFWLYYNPKNLLGFGKHEGDWEMVQVGLRHGEPEVASYAQHDSGEARPFGKGMDLVPGDALRPIAYVAPLSHASYFEARTHPYFIGIDDPRGDGPRRELPVVPFGDWVNWEGRWGSGERGIARRIGFGPNSPARQGLKWRDPGAWHARLRYRRVRVLLGEVMHRLGALTSPSAPGISEATRSGRQVKVSWELRGAGPRRGAHLYITVHERHLVIASRVVRNAPAQDSTTLITSPDRQPEEVLVSAFNGLRQRSDPAKRVISEEPSG
jgi:hypothetical protein